MPASLRRLVDGLIRAIARGDAARSLATVFAAALFVVAIKRVVGPFFDDLTKAGIHDWDSAASYRYITVLSLKRFHELPWYHPYFCGGFPAWAYSEGASNLVSIFFPFYWIYPIWIALRIEVMGTVLISLVATYALAARYTKSVALAAFVAVAYSLNGRWALQATAGHAWHLQYCYVPVALFCFDVACERGRLRWALGAGVAIALMVYAGAIYPAPHTAVVLVIWALLRAWQEWSARPLGALAIAGLSGAGLAMPKLLPLADLMTRYSRKIDSTEAIGLNELGAMLAAPNQGFYRGVAPVPAYGWHEWGMYVGWYSCVAMLFALMFARGPRQTPLKFAGLVFLVLSLGAFADKAPWTLLHKLPVFSSQHVPSRFMFVAFLCLMIAFVAWLGERLRRPLERWPSIDLLIMIPVWVAAMDIADVSHATTIEAFTLDPPRVAWHRDFKQISNPTYNYNPPGAWAGPSQPAMDSNEGFIGCYSVTDRADPKGAIANDSPAYQGEVYFGEGGGHAAITEWSPNHAVVEYTGATPGSVLVYNMNWDTSWTANGARALDWNHAVAVRLDQAQGRVRFTYFPRTMPLALLIFALTIACIALGPRAARRLSSRFQS